MLSLVLCIKTHYFTQNKSYYRVSILVDMCLQAILIVGIYFHRSVFTVKTSCILCRYHLWCFYTQYRKQKKPLHSSSILHYFDSVFYYFNVFMKILKVLFWILVLPKLNIGSYQKAIWKCSCPFPDNDGHIVLMNLTMTGVWLWLITCNFCFVLQWLLMKLYGFANSVE